MISLERHAGCPTPPPPSIPSSSFLRFIQGVHQNEASVLKRRFIFSLLEAGGTTVTPDLFPETTLVPSLPAVPSARAGSAPQKPRRRSSSGRDSVARPQTLPSACRPGPKRGSMEVGMRVVRGLDWKWGNQDDGEGHVGTVVEIGRQGSTTTPDKTVVVQWDSGTRTNYRTGYQGAYDLLLYDNAQIGVRHSNIICDSCKKHGIMGMRWKCKVCFDYDLCTQCYMNNKHDLSHAFERYETAHSQPVSLAPRQNLPRIILKGIFQGVKVVRGPDWDWGNQDGTVISVLEKLLSQSTEQDNPSRLVIEAAHGSASKVRELVQKYPDKVDIKNQGKTALQVAAHQGHMEVVKALLQANSSVEVKDEDGDTALHYTAFGNQAEIARLLLSKGANVNLLNNSMCTALHIAVNKGFTDVVRVLTEHSADVNLQDSYGDTPLHDAIAKDFRNIIEILSVVPNIDFTQQNHRGFNLLHHAALKGNKLATEKILARARQLVDVKKEDGFSALHLAALNNHKDVAEILIKEGRCDINIRNNRNQTPLQLAVTQGHTELVQLLVDEGADVNMEDEDGDTAMHVALLRPQLANVMLSPSVGTSSSEESSDGCSSTSLYCRLNATGLLGSTELSVGTAVACFLAMEGADISYANHKGKSPLDLVADSTMLQLIKSFSEKHRLQRLQAITCGQGLSSASLRRVHTTPNTMTNLVLPTPPGPSECLICSELALLVLFCPCQHSVACEECAHRMKKCIKCQVTITKKIRQDQTEVDCSPGTENSEQHNLLEQLQSRYRQMEERMTCPICIDNHIKLVFQCGHASCIDCSAALKTCPICRQTIRERIQLFV
ncbi:E3 ubiquitin-protein ligase MIB2 isoform X7 [Haplochromis burtoni]|uniref:E3 ubiquitin-protein ligase MIB2 isoform X7 n=1 Tax=Haplochromis burtoni TaxID=8153 RepID=UPI0006C96A9F|nr:E3 ubiquitin-protein ligase MIB2 isoform X7 [Haplochromis burtoni]